MKERSSRIVAVILAVVMAVPLWAVQGEPQMPDPGSSPISKEEQIEIGKKAKAQVYQQMPVLPDSSPVTQYVQQLGRRLTAVIPQEYSWPFEFHVVQQKEINAFAIPGGPLFINLGTITSADNEAQLAGVMAHEIAHVYMQHSAKQAGKASMTQGLASVLGGMLGGGLGGSLARAGLGLGAGLLSMKYSRSDESGADAVGAIILYKAGYNPKAMADFFQKLAQEGGGGPQFLSDHPNPGNRENAIQREVASWPRKNFSQGNGQFQRVRNLASQTRAYSAQEIADRGKSGGWASVNSQQGSRPASGDTATGATAAGTMRPVSRSVFMPSGGFKTLNQQLYSIQYPSNWQAQGDGKAAAQIAPQGAATEGGIAYGVIINAGQAPDRGNFDEVVTQLVNAMQADNPGLRQSGSLQSITVNGLRGRAVQMIGNSPIQENGRPARERDWLIALQHPDGYIVYTVFVAPDKDFNTLRPTFDQMLRSWQFN